LRGEAVFVGDVGGVSDGDVQDDHVLLEYVVVLDVGA